MGAEQVELDDHGVVGVVEDGVLVALIGKRGACGAEVLGDLLGAVVYFAGGDDLVARVVERPHRDVELVPVLRLHVLADDGLPAVAQRLRDRPPRVRTISRRAVAGVE